ncbi:hypothetical protein [Lysobacter gummosus]|uniref:hypothetical protein n=1 Tax=Lysobacter gummosus TaxID=262324 RepID=UPI00362D39B9
MRTSPTIRNQAATCGCPCRNDAVQRWRRAAPMGDGSGPMSSGRFASSSRRRPSPAPRAPHPRSHRAQRRRRAW